MPIAPKCRYLIDKSYYEKANSKLNRDFEYSVLLVELYYYRTCHSVCLKLRNVVRPYICLLYQIQRLR